MDIVYWNIEYLLEFFKLYLIVVKLMGYEYKKNSKGFIIGLIGVTILVPILLYNGLEHKITYVVGISAMIVITVFLKKWKDIFVVILSYLIICVVDAILASLYALLMGYNFDIILENHILNFVGNFLSIFLFLILYKIKLMWKIGRITLNKKQIVIMLFGIIGIALYIAPVQMLGLMQEGDRTRLFTVLGIDLSGTAFIIICIYLIILNKSNKYYQECLIINKKLLEQQKQYYSMLIKKDKDTRKFKHDITNHIYCMRILFEDEKYDELYSYMIEMNGTIERLNYSIETGNDIVNVIASDILGEKLNRDILVRWKGKLPDKLKISNMDLCIIFSNLFKNSVEAVVKILDNEEKTIEVDIKQLDRSLIIKISNSVNERVSIINNKLVTSKLDKNKHGFGSLSIEDIVNKYGGDIKYISTEKNFLVEIIFNDIIIN